MRPIEQNLPAAVPPLQAPGPEHPLDSLAQSRFRQIDPLPAQQGSGGKGQGEILMLMPPGQARPQRFQGKSKSLEGKAVRLRDQGEILATEEGRRLAPSGQIIQHAAGRRRLAGDNHRHPGFNDPSLLSGNGRQVGSQVLRMVTAERM